MDTFQIYFLFVQLSYFETVVIRLYCVYTRNSKVFQVLRCSYPLSRMVWSSKQMVSGSIASKGEKRLWLFLWGECLYPFTKNRVPATAG